MTPSFYGWLPQPYLSLTIYLWTDWWAGNSPIISSLNHENLDYINLGVEGIFSNTSLRDMSKILTPTVIDRTELNDIIDPPV